MCLLPPLVMHCTHTLCCCVASPPMVRNQRMAPAQYGGAYGGTKEGEAPALTRPRQWWLQSSGGPHLKRQRACWSQSTAPRTQQNNSGPDGSNPAEGPIPHARARYAVMDVDSRNKAPGALGAPKHKKHSLQWDAGLGGPKAARAPVVPKRLKAPQRSGHRRGGGKVMEAPVPMRPGS